MVIFAVLYLQPRCHPYRVCINCAIFLHKPRISPERNKTSSIEKRRCKLQTLPHRQTFNSMYFGLQAAKNSTRVLTHPTSGHQAGHCCVSSCWIFNMKVAYLSMQTVSQKTVQICFCQKLGKFPPILIIFDNQMAIIYFQSGLSRKSTARST